MPERIVLQLGVYLGYVTVDWSRVHKDVLSLFDVNSNGYVLIFYVSIAETLRSSQHYNVRSQTHT